MTLTLSVIYSVPEFDLSAFFLLSCASGKSGLNGNTGLNTGNGSSADPERIRLHSSGSSGPMYTQQQDERSGSTLVQEIMIITNNFFGITKISSKTMVSNVITKITAFVINGTVIVFPLFWFQFQPEIIQRIINKEQ